MMKKWWLGLITLIFSTNLWAQSLHLSLPQLAVNNGESVVMPLTVTDFDSIVSLQFSIQWDIEVATFTDANIDALPLLAIGDFQADQGELRISWFDNTGNGRTLADGTVIAHLTFTAMGVPGDFTPLPFTNGPLAIQIFKATDTPGVFEPLGLTQDEGRIAIAAPLGFNINIQDVNCAGDADGSAQVSLSVNMDDYTIAWLGPDGFTASTYDITGLSGGDYSLTINDLSANQVFDYSFTLNEASDPVSISSLETVPPDCNETNGMLTVNAQGGELPYTYHLDETISTNGQFSNLGEGDYQLQISDVNGCLYNETITLQAPDSPIIELADSLQLCNESVLLSPGAIGNYQWSTGATTNILEVAETGVYSLTVTNEEACFATDSIVISSGAAPTAFLETDFTELCPNDSLQLEISGGSVYEWLNNNEVLSANDIPNPIAYPDTSTTFMVVVGNNCGLDTLAFELHVYDILATAGEDNCIGPGLDIELTASGGLFYEWLSNTQSLSAIDIPNPIASPEDSTTYQVSIIDINGCETLDEVTILVANDPVQSITPYNLISPNGDGKNDVLDFDEISKFGDNSLKVYNRWGDLIYQKRNYQQDEERFDGSINGVLLPAGNYFYILAFRQGSIKQTLTIVHE